MYSKNSLLENQWKIKDFDERHSLLISQRYQISPILAKLLNIRNISDDQIDEFLKPDLINNLPNPFLLKDMQKSINRIIEAILKKELIGIIADYDVDGSASAALICKFFKSIKQKYVLKIPDRLINGYGPNVKILDELIKDKIQILLTLDCGTTSFDIFDINKYQIFDTIVIDHHISETIFPKVFSIINPNRFDENNDYINLAAVGVVFLFILALRKELRKINFFKNNNLKEPNLLNYLDLVALGTVCDVVSLKKYNRLFVSKGIEIIHKRSNKGISAIIDNTKINHTPKASDLSYIIGPQLNAASRIENSSLASKLLISEDIFEIESISRKILLLNEKRKLIEKKVFEEALSQIDNIKNKNIIIVKGENWHKGVIGIVASRLVEKFNRPSIVISFDNEYGIGSARSLRSIDLGNIILSAKHNGLLINGGGHKMAAGFKISMKKFQKFLSFLIENFNKYDASYFEKYLYFDSIIKLDEVNLNLIENIEKLEPFGINNPDPKFIIQNVDIEFAKIIKENHVILGFKNNDSIIKGISFNCVQNLLGQNLLNYKLKKFDIGCSIKKDIYQGNNEPQLIIHDAIVIN